MVAGLTGWFGAPGSLVPVMPYMGSVSEDSGRVVTESIGLSGARRVQVGGGSSRSWSLGVAGSPAQVAPFRYASSTAVPWVWVSPAAQVSNLLTPGQSALTSPDVTFSGGAFAQTGALATGDGFATSWAGGANGAAVTVTGGSKRVPVRAGVPVCVSAYVQRVNSGTPVAVFPAWHDATGTAIGSASGTSPVGTGLVRASWLFTPPAGAAEMSLVIRNAGVLANPQVTWTATEQPYADGRGVYRVAVTEWSEDQERILPDGSLWVQASLKLVEVG